MLNRLFTLRSGPFAFLRGAMGSPALLVSVLLGMMVSGLYLDSQSHARAAIALALAVVALHIRPRRDPVKSSGRIEATLGPFMKTARERGQTTGLIIAEIDDYASICQVYDDEAVDQLQHSVQQRIAQVIRREDRLARIGPGRYAVALAPQLHLDLERGLNVAKRLQDAVQASGDGASPQRLTLCAGLCLSSRLRTPCANTLMLGAEQALDEARRSGPAAIRSHSDLSTPQNQTQNGLLGEIDDALARGQLKAYFQPQISARTGEIVGFEALIRWLHPNRGIIPPAEFLPLLERTGEISKITHLMITQALGALDHWAGNGVHIRRVGINFSTPELMDRNLLDHISFELDRFGIGADRLAVEVLETVVAGQSDDTIIRNLAGLARMGTCIDLDDFGTGHASITNIQRFSVERIKIDRSFITGIAQNPEQQNMVAAILTMANRLGLATLAEGVEREDERHLLTELGCAYLQGFGIGRPMSLEETDSWIRAYGTRLRGGHRPKRLAN